MTTRVGIAGFGAIGRQLAERLDAGLDGFTLTAIATRTPARAEQFARDALNPVAVVPAAELVTHADVILECVPAQAFAEVVTPLLDRGLTVISVSGAAILEHPEVVARAGANGGRLVLASGALGALDVVRAAALGRIRASTIVTRKPPRSLAKARLVVERGIDLAHLDAPLRLFAGPVREGARLFPANVNVAAALALAGIGPDRTQLEVWADPAVERNTHRVIVEADTVRFEFQTENVPSPENPGTGRVTALSMLAALQSLASPFRVGT